MPLFPILHLETVSRHEVPYHSCFSFCGDFSTEGGSCAAWAFIVGTTLESQAAPSAGHAGGGWQSLSCSPHFVVAHPDGFLAVDGSIQSSVEAVESTQPAACILLGMRKEDGKRIFLLIGKEVREGHILHPSKTLGNGSASPSQSRKVKEAERRGRRAEMQVCERMNENRIEKVNSHLGQLCCSRVKLD